ncbi:MAG: glycosyltransferase family 4 protein [Candidatus Moraniibacteriota bacterium]|nr:MAG: glycosyltransferase family 4 protein [Candidatus Moranbacteria bacterium]
MKICFFSLSAYPLFKSGHQAVFGGSELQLSIVAEHLASRHEISFIVADFGQADTERIGDYTFIKSIRLGGYLSPWFRVKSLFILIKALYRTDADIFITSAAGPEVGVIALFCKVLRKRFIYRTASSIDCDGEYIRKNGFRGKLFKFGLEHADVIIAQSKENEALLKKHYGIDAVLIKNAFAIHEHDETGIVSESEKKGILWVGRMEPNKRPETYLKLAKKFPRERFVMIAPKQNHLVEYFEMAFNKAQSMENVQFIERVPFDKIQEYFNKARLLVCTSEYEGFPNVHLQSCIGGTPVVTLNINPDNYITKNNIGYCADSVFEKMIDQIETLLNDEGDWKKKSTNAFRYAKENHDINIVGKQWEELLYSLARN